MEGSGSPRFGKLNFPVGLWINSPRKHFAKLGGRWPSAISVKSVCAHFFSCYIHLLFANNMWPYGLLTSYSYKLSWCRLILFPLSFVCFIVLLLWSVIIYSWLVSSSSLPLMSICPNPPSTILRSTTSSDAASLHEAPSAPSSSLSNSTPSLASPSPSPSPSPAFLRPKPAAPQSRTKRISQLFLRGRSNSDRDRAVGERERELWASSATPSSHHYLPPASSSAPGLIKIYGDALSSGANYRSLLANVHSTARQLISQVITRYTERERDENDDAGMTSAAIHYCF